MRDIVLIVPCYNEADRLDPDVWMAGLAAEPRLSLRFVDDGSTDRTLDVLEGLRARDPARVELTVCERNGGKAEAVRRGVLAALAHESAPDASEGPRYVGYWDADLATPLDEATRFAALLDERNELRLVLGSRVRLLGRDVSRKATRHLFGRAFATVVSTMLALPVYDTQCGAKLFRVVPELADVFSEPFLSRWIFDVEVLVRLMRAWEHEGHDARDLIVEQPLLRWEDVGGSKVTPKDAVRAFAELRSIWKRYRGVLERRRATARSVWT